MSKVSHFAGAPQDERLQWSLSSQEGHESYARMARTRGRETRQRPLYHAKPRPCQSGPRRYEGL